MPRRRDDQVPKDVPVTDSPPSSPKFGRLRMPAAASASQRASHPLGVPLEVVRLVGVGVLVWGSLATSRPTDAAHRAVLGVLLALGVAGYLGFFATKGRSRRAMVISLLVLAIGGGAVGSFGGLGVVFPVILGLAAGTYLPDRVALGLVATSLASLAVAISAAGGSWVVLGWAALAGAGGLMAGMNRRQFQLRAEQSEQLLVERERTEAEATHAATLAERNRIAREVHDVLAHSLGALAVQLEVVDALLEEGDIERAKAAVVTSRRLSVEGLDETRQAVHALRDAPLALGEQLAALAARNSASFRIDGTERVLPAEAGLALYRAAQEALTNARKHAPGATASVVLDFGADRTSLSVVDEYPAGSERLTPRSVPSGPGYGLAGMRERVELLGGSSSVGPTGGDTAGWRVEVEIPARRNGSGPT
jgi:signal transduction histidine kinase